MKEILNELNRRIATLAADRTTGASGILSTTLEILGIAKAANIDMRQVAEALCLAQPTMASVWNASAAALSDNPTRFTQFAERVRRALTQSRDTRRHFSVMTFPNTHYM